MDGPEELDGESEGERLGEDLEDSEGIVGHERETPEYIPGAGLWADAFETQLYEPTADSLERVVEDTRQQEEQLVSDEDAGNQDELKRSCNKDR